MIVEMCLHILILTSSLYEHKLIIKTKYEERVSVSGLEI